MMRGIRGRLDDLARRVGPAPAGLTTRLLEEAGEGQYRDRGTGRVYSEAELDGLPGALVIRERIVSPRVDRADPSKTCLTLNRFADCIPTR